MPGHAMRDTDAGTQTPTATPERVAVFTIHYAHGAAPRGAYTIRALEGQLALLPTAEPPAMRRSVTADISVASSPERSCSASLHAPPFLGSTGPEKSMPSIARGPEIGQAARFLPAQGSDERKPANGNLRSLLMTFTIAPPLRESRHAVDSRPPGSGLDDARAAHTTSALPVAWIVTPLCPATAACVYSIINVPRLTSIVKHSKGHSIAWGAISTYTAGGRHQDANPCPQPEADLARSPRHAALTQRTLLAVLLDKSHLHRHPSPLTQRLCLPSMVGLRCKTAGSRRKPLVGSRQTGKEPTLLLDSGVF